MFDVHATLREAKTIFDSSSFLRVMNFDAPKEKWRKGGFLCLSDSVPGKGFAVLAIVPFGDVDSNPRRERYYRNAVEKASRLHAHPETYTSWETRNEAEGMFGGAIRNENGILSFSGLFEPADEAFMTILCERIGSTMYLERLEKRTIKSGSEDLRRKYWMSLLP